MATLNDSKIYLGSDLLIENGGGGGGGSDTAKGGMLPQGTTFNELQFSAKGELQ